MLVSSTYLNAGQRLILGNRGAPVSGVTSLRRRRCSIQGRRNSSVTTALFGARGSGKNQQNGPQKIAPPPEIPLTQKVHVPSTATAVAAGLLGGFLAYLFWSKLYEYWKRVAPHHADKNDPGPYGGAFAKGPPPPKAVPLIPRNLEQVEAEKVLALRELESTKAALQDERRQLELLKGNRTSFVEQVAAAQATLRQMGGTSAPPDSATAARLSSLETRLKELLTKRAEAEQAVRASEEVVERIQRNIAQGEEMLVRLDKRAAELRRDEKGGQVGGGTSTAQGTAGTAFADVAAAAEEAVLRDGFLEKPQTGTPFEDPAYDHAIEIMRREMLPRVQGGVWQPPEEEGPATKSEQPIKGASGESVMQKPIDAGAATAVQLPQEPALSAPPHAVQQEVSSDRAQEKLPPASAKQPDAEALLPAPQEPQLLVTAEEPVALLPEEATLADEQDIPPPAGAEEESEAGGVPLAVPEAASAAKGSGAGDAKQDEDSTTATSSPPREGTAESSGEDELTTLFRQLSAAQRGPPEEGWTQEGLKACISAAEDDLETLKASARSRMGDREAAYDLELRAKVDEAREALLELERKATKEASDQIPQAVARLEERGNHLKQLYEGMMTAEEKEQAAALTSSLATWHDELEALFSSSRTAPQGQLEKARRRNAELRKAVEEILLSLDAPDLSPEDLQAKLRQLQALREEMALMIERNTATIEAAEQAQISDLQIGDADALAVLGGEVASLSGNGAAVKEQEQAMAESLDRLWEEKERQARDMLSIPGHRQLELLDHGAQQSLLDAQTLRMVAGGAAIPHPDKGAEGEDAHFVSQDGLGAVGIADGVGGWALEGLDAGEYSRRLMKNALSLIQATAERERLSFRAQQVMRQAHEGVGPILGSTTALVALLRPGNILEIANVGDSGFRLLRGGSILFSSTVQQHSFNLPYQLASPELLPEADTADDAALYEIDAQQGDILILGTDGLFDNMWNDQLERIVNNHLQFEGRNGVSATRLAHKIAEAAAINQVDESFRSPWAVEAAAAGRVPLWDRLNPRGGKKDDCTVVVGFLETLAAPVSSNPVDSADPQPAAAA